MSKKLYLIPTLLGDGDPQLQLSADVLSEIRHVQYVIAENEKNARRFLVGCGMREVLGQIEFALLNEHTRPEDYGFLLEPLFEGKTTGIMSDAGCPGVADPGAELVSIAHAQGIEVVPLVGPSSLLLALMASGLNGQEFAFKGYLPVKAPLRIKRLKDLERRSAQINETQVFIEAPYRNNQLIQDLLCTLNPNTRLCLAANLSTPDQMVKTMTIQQWKKQRPDLNKIPAVFLFLA